jgi:hypothetical protein
MDLPQILKTADLITVSEDSLIKNGNSTQLNFLLQNKRKSTLL